MSRSPIFLILLVAVCSQPQAQDDGPIFLLRGPHPSSGIWFLAPNDIAYALGEYRDGEATISVYYTEEAIVSGSTWGAGNCGRTATLLMPSLETQLIYFDSGEDWSVFFELPLGYERSCEFIEVFLRRLGYFRSVAAAGGGVPLPAILEL